MPSSAVSEAIGLAPGAQKASTQWAIAFIAEGPVTDGGKESVSSGS